MNAILGYECAAKAPERHGIPRNTKIGLNTNSIQTFPTLFGFRCKGVAVPRHPFGGFVVIRWALGSIEGHMREMSPKR